VERHLLVVALEMNARHAFLAAWPALRWSASLIPNAKANKALKTRRRQQ
jgi:hypothetical protein